MNRGVRQQIIIWIFVGVLILALLVASFLMRDRRSASIGIIGGADGPTAIFVADDDRPPSDQVNNMIEEYQSYTTYYDEAVSIEDLEAIDISVHSDKMLVLPSEDGQLRLVHQGQNLRDQDIYTLRRNSHSLSVGREGSLWGWLPDFSDLFALNRKSLLLLYMPAGYSNDLSLSIASGHVSLLTDLSPGNFFFKLASGDLDGDRRIDTGVAQVDIASGSMFLSGLYTNAFELKLASGSLDITSLSGSGSATVTSGDLNVHSLTLEEKLQIDVTSGFANIALAGNPSIDYAESVSSGTVNTYFDSAIVKGQQPHTGKIGDAPYKEVRVKVTSGFVSIPSVGDSE